MPKRVHSASFKAKVALEAFRGEKAMSELAVQTVRTRFSSVVGRRSFWPVPRRYFGWLGEEPHG